MWRAISKLLSLVDEVGVRLVEWTPFVWSGDRLWRETEEQRRKEMREMRRRMDDPGR